MVFTVIYIEFLASAGSDFVTITIASNQKFSAHAHMLVYHSEYFRRAFNSQFQEATTRTFDLSIHATEATISAFIKWIYQKNPKPLEDQISCSCGNTTGWKTLFDGLSDRDAIESWFFGDYIQAKEFRNDLLHFMFSRDDFDRTAIVDVWDRIPLESKLRPFLISRFCLNIVELRDVDRLLESLPSTMVLEVSRYVIRQLKESTDRYSLCKLRFDIKDYLEDM
nr:C102A protein [Hypoxylon sp. CO27-5]